MNPKFFDVKKEKQDAIINAALIVFAENGYKKASTDVIVKEAGISKGLLFHYFISKQGLYEFVYDYSVKYMVLELTQSVKSTETDFFEIQRMIELAKTRVMKNYPYMQQFLSSVKYETHADALGIIGETGNVIEDTYNNIYKKADMSKFYSQIDVAKIIQMIGWMSDGFIKDKFRDGTPDLDEMNEEFTQYLSMMREHFYAGTGFGLSADTDDTVAGRADSVMESMRFTAGATSQVYVPELSFEERLAAGKKSAYAPVEEEPAKDDEISSTEDEASENEVSDEAEAAKIETVVNVEDGETLEGKDITEAETSDAEDSGEDNSETDIDDSIVKDSVNEEQQDNESEDDSPVIAVDGLIKADDQADEAAEKTASEDTSVEESEAVENSIENAESEADDKVNSEATEVNEEDSAQNIVESIGSVELDDKENDNNVIDGMSSAEELAEAVGSILSSETKASLAKSEFRELVMPEGYDDNYASYDSIGSEVAGVYEEEGFVLDDLSEKIISNALTPEEERAKELESMGPAPVLPEFDPESIKKKVSTIDDVVEEEQPLYYPLRF